MEYENKLREGTLAQYYKVRSLNQIFLEAVESSNSVPDKYFIAFQVMQEELETLGNGLEKIMLYYCEMEKKLKEFDGTDVEDIFKAGVCEEPQEKRNVCCNVSSRLDNAAVDASVELIRIRTVAELVLDSTEQIVELPDKFLVVLEIVRDGLDRLEELIGTVMDIAACGEEETTEGGDW